MPDARRFLTADERLKELQRDRKALRRERMIREVAGPVWHRMVRVIPLSFEGQGRLVARELLASREAVIEALRSDAVFAVDTAMRLAHGAGFLASYEVYAYLTGAEPLNRLAAEGLIAEEDYFDSILVRPWSGPPRLLACLVDQLPPSRGVQDGYRVVTRERLGQETGRHGRPAGRPVRPMKRSKEPSPRSGPRPDGKRCRFGFPPE